MLHWWISNGSSFQVHLWSVLKFLTPSNPETITHISLADSKPLSHRLVALCTPPLLQHHLPEPLLVWCTLILTPTFSILFAQGEVSMRHTHKGASHTHAQTHTEAPHAYGRHHTFIMWLQGPLRANVWRWHRRQLHPPCIHTRRHTPTHKTVHSCASMGAHLFHCLSAYEARRVKKKNQTNLWI